MKDLTPLEQQMRQLAASYSPTPPAGAWDIIARGLEEENKKVWPMVLYIIGGTLLLAGIIYWLSQTSNASSSDSKPSPIEYKTSGNDGAAATEGVNERNHMAQVEPGKNGLQEDNIDQEQAQGQRDIESSLAKTSVKNTKVNEHKEGSTVMGSSSLSKSGVKTSSDPTNKWTDQSSRKQTLPFITDTNESTKTKVVSRSSAPATAATQEAQSTSPIITKQSLKSPTLAELVSTDSPVSQMNISTSGSQSTMERNEVYPNIKSSTEAALSSEEQSNNKPDIKCPVFKNINKVQYFADAQLGLGYPVRHLSATSDNFAYLTRRESTEQPWYLWSGEVKAGVTLYEKFSISTGVNFTQLKETFHEERLGVIKITIVTFPDGQTDTTITSGTEIYKGEIMHSLLNIPLKVGYQRAIKRWIVGVEAGALWNISQRSRGWVLYPVNTITRIENENIFKKKIGIGYTGGVSVGTNVGRNMYAYLNPQVTYFPTKWNVPEYKIDQKYIIPEIKVGIRFMFD